MAVSFHQRVWARDDTWAFATDAGGGSVKIAVVGTGFIGGILGRALARAGHVVTFGSRHPDDDAVASDSGALVASFREAVADADAIVLAIPGAGVAQFS